MLTHKFGVDGTAMAMSLTVLVGTVFALRRSTRFVDVPWTRSLAPPLLAAAATTALRMAADSFIGTFPGLPALAIGSTLFLFAYASTLLALERRTLLNELATLISVLRKDGS